MDIERKTEEKATKEERMLMLKEFKAEHRIEWPILLGEGTVKPYNIKNIPATMIVDKKGVITFFYVGEITMEELRVELDKILK